MQLLDFDLLLPQEAGVSIVLDGKILLLGGSGQGIRNVLGILEGLAIEKVRISILLLVVLGEEGCDKLLLTELVRLHCWGVGGREGTGGTALVLAGDESRAARTTEANPA